MRNTDPSLEKFLKLDGGVETLLAVDPVSGSITGDIKSNILVSDNTAQSRIEEARELELVEPRENDHRDHPNATRYYLTKRGRVCLVGIVGINLDEKIKSHHELTKEINNLKDVIADWTERMSVSDVEESSTPTVSSESFKDENTYHGGNLPDNFEEFITATLEYNDIHALEIWKFIDYEHLFDSEYNKLDE
jgi:hypothetical protein